MKSKSLILVDADNNRNCEYIMVQENPRQFQAIAKRVSASDVIRRYPMSQWDNVYQKRLREGFIDRPGSQIMTVSGAKHKEIEDDLVRDLVTFLIERSRKVIEENYTISYEAVTTEMVENAEKLISKISHTNNSDDFNEGLLNLFRTIPRKMSDVKEFLMKKEKDHQDFKKMRNHIISRERELLEVMRSQVNTNKIENSPEHTILEEMNCEIRECRPDEYDGIKKHLSQRTAARMGKAFKVINKTTRDRFSKCMKDNGMSDKDIHYYYHGSKNMNYFGLITEGPKLNPDAPITGKMFGHGIYFADCADKSMGYTDIQGSRWAKGNSNRAYLAIYKVCYKNAQHVQKWHSYMPTLNKKKLAPYDALFAHGGVDLINNEVIVYDEAQVDIWALIELKC